MSGTGTERLLRASFDEHGARGPNRRGDYQLCCPFCEDRVGKVDEKFKLSANPGVINDENSAVKGAWVCWRCDARGWGGVEFLAEVEQVDEGKPDLGAPEGFVPFHGNEDSLAIKPYRDYLRGRQVLEFAEAVGAGACLHGRFAGRVVVPHVVNKEWAGFSARALHRETLPKYLYPRGMDRRHALWGLEWVPDDYQPIYIVEGVFDALPLFPYGIATFGKSVTDEQMAILASIDREVVCCLDGDAWTECRSLCSRITMRRTNGKPVRWARLPAAMDPGVLGWKIKDYVSGQQVALGGTE